MKISTRKMCCLFLSVTVFTFLISFANFTRASRARAFERETVYSRPGVNFTHFQRDVADSGYRNRTAVLSTDNRHIRSRYRGQYVISLMNKQGAIAKRPHAFAS